MKILSGNVVAVFVGDAGIGSGFGQIGPQVRYFDIYYVNPPVVGFQVSGSAEEES